MKKPVQSDFPTSWASRYGIGCNVYAVEAFYGFALIPILSSMLFIHLAYPCVCRIPFSLRSKSYFLYSIDRGENSTLSISILVDWSVTFVRSPMDRGENRRWIEGIKEAPFRQLTFKREQFKKVIGLGMKEEKVCKIAISQQWTVEYHGIVKRAFQLIRGYNMCRLFRSKS